MKRFLCLLIVFIGCIGICFVLNNRRAAKNYSSMVVQFFPFNNRPIIKLEIESKKYSCLIDTGSSHLIDLQKQHIQEIKQKEPLEIRNYIGVRGKSYPTQSYKFPDLKMANVVISGVVGFEENLDFIRDASFESALPWWTRFKEELELWTTSGRIGWKFFEIGCPLFDFANMNLCFAKDLSTLVDEAGYSLDGFTKIPFQLANCGVIFTIKTEAGIKKFVLDTGATHSVLRKNGSECKLIRTTLTIGNNDFGSWRFNLIDFADQFECEGILGVDFFLSHKICLDFPNKMAYIKQNESLLKKIVH